MTQMMINTCQTTTSIFRHTQGINGAGKGYRTALVESYVNESIVKTTFSTKLQFYFNGIKPAKFLFILLKSWHGFCVTMHIERKYA